MEQKSALIQVRVDENLKRKADELFSELGFDTPTAIRIFLNQAIRRAGMPFDVVKHQFNELERIPKQYDSFKEILAEIDAEIEAEGIEKI